ncbi:MAG: hypothetical protein LUE64_07200 [Candidatus Gastranaerophilales bacterium]|nr:hypothetical protein [Candidatus Gastranaerophilales bacterium]
MADNFESLNNLEEHVRKSSVVQERTGLVAVHMYKQFLDFQKSTQNTAEIFVKMGDVLNQVVDSLKQSFSVRNIPSGNIYCEIDSTKTIATINILWHTISFTSRFNISPKALPRNGQTPLFCGRIFAVNGNYLNLMQGVNDYDGQVKVLLDNEIASLYVPAEKNQNVIMTIRHKDNQESLLSHVDSPRDFPLKVIEIVCAGGQFHEQNPKNKFFF